MYNRIQKYCDLFIKNLHLRSKIIFVTFNFMTYNFTTLSLITVLYTLKFNAIFYKYRNFLLNFFYLLISHLYAYFLCHHLS